MRARIGLLLAVMVAGAGCAMSPEDRLVGIWSFDRENSKLPNITGLPIPGMENQMEQIQATLRNIKLKVLSDHTFVFSGTAVMDGKWQYHAGVLELKPNREGPGMFFRGKTLKAKVGEDMRSLSVTQDSPLGDVVLRLRKTG